MAMVKWTPGAEWETLRHEMNRLFERALPEVFGHEVDTAAAWPRLDVRETAAAYVVETDLPGMTAETITVEALEDSYVFVLSGEPINEPIVSYGPFVMNYPGEIKQAIMDYEMGKMGVLEE